MTSVTDKYLHLLFTFFLLLALLLSFYFFIITVVLNKDKHRSIFTTWQFPMLLAVFMDVLYVK